MKRGLAKLTEGLEFEADGADGNPAMEIDTMISIGAAAWRVLCKARKAAIARNEKSADAERRNVNDVPGVSALNVARRQGASANDEELGGQAFAPKRSRF